ncbi:MAG: glycerol-3-phosphate dehydrogenase [Nanoarchaeota archaeon]|nr:glycerol-3-phosphate dehydrogenase [Nanoarchaeota archaeon]
MKISILGAGSWGTTIAILLGKKGYEVSLWCRRKELAEEIERERENKAYVPNVKLPENIIPSNEISKVIEDSSLIIVAVPSAYFRDVIKKLPKITIPILSVSKGLELNTYKRMSEVVKEELGSLPFAVLSGPNHSEEIVKELPAATTLASKDLKLAKELSNLFSTSYLKVFPSEDIAGTETCGALKNTTAIAVGICKGLDLGENAKSAIITLGLEELKEFGNLFGAESSTCYGLAGIGDLITTCSSKHSRNRSVGLQLARNKKLQDIKIENMIAEGITTTKAIYEISKERNLKMPLTEQVYLILYKNKEPKKAISDLLENI